MAETQIEPKLLLSVLQGEHIILVYPQQRSFRKKKMAHQVQVGKKLGSN